MKQVVKLMVVLLCAASIATLSSCSKDENTVTTNNGSSEGDSPNGNTPRKFSFGYYHPEKKLKKVCYHYYEDEYNGERNIVYNFIWDGNNLTRIVEIYGSYYGSYSNTFECFYDDKGYITKWNYVGSGGHLTFDYGYEENAITYGSYGDDYRFDNDGNMIWHYFWGNVTMKNGNLITNRYDYEDYDNHPNPYTNLLIPNSIHGMFPFQEMDAYTISKNNYIDYSTMEYDSDGWPIRWLETSTSYPDGLYITFEYYD